MLILLILFIVFPIAIFFYWGMPFYFYFYDDWSGIYQYQKLGTKAIFLSVNEHFVPVAKIFFYIESKIYGFNAIYLHYETLLIHFLVTIILMYFVYLLFKKKLLSFLAGFIFAFNPLLWESFFLQGGRYTMLNVFLFFMSLIFLLLFFQKRRSVFFSISLFFLILQTFSYGFGIFLNFIYFLFFIMFVNKKKDKSKIALIFIIVILLTLSYIFLSPLRSFTLNAGGLSFIEKIRRISDYFYFAAISNFVRPIIFFILPSDFSVVLKRVYLSFFVFSLLIFYAFLNDKKNRKILIWTIFYFLSFVISISLSRYDWGPAQSLSSRYVYNYLAPLIILICYLVDFYAGKIGKHNNIYKSLIFFILFFYGVLFVFKYRIVEFYKNHYSKLHYYNYSELRKKELNADYFADVSQLSPGYDQNQLLDMFKKLRTSAILKNYPNIPEGYPLVKKTQSLKLYPNNNHHIPGGITKGTFVYQTFLSNYQRFTGLNIFISTFGKKIVTPYELIILDSKCNKQIRKTTVDYKKIDDNDYFQIFFSEITNSKNIKYCFTIRSVTNNIVTPITLQLSKPEKYLSGELFINNKLMDEDLVFEPLFN